MSELLRTLADDWHKPNPYKKVILSVVPSSKYVEEIEDSLLALYAASHHEFKIYKTPTKYTVYDNSIDEWTLRKKKIQEEMKREDDTLEKLAKKFAEVQKFLDPTLDAQEENEEDEEEDEVVLPKERGKERLKAHINKAISHNKKEEEKRMAKQAKLTKENMASSQDKILTLQKEMEEIEKKLEYYGHYRHASLGFSNSMKRIVLAYEETRDLEAAIKELADLHAYYDMIRRRYVSNEPCSGLHTDDNLCETHLLPLTPARYSSAGLICTARCSLSPV